MSDFVPQTEIARILCQIGEEWRKGYRPVGSWNSELVCGGGPSPELSGYWKSHAIDFGQLLGLSMPFHRPAILLTPFGPSKCGKSRMLSKMIPIHNLFRTDYETKTILIVIPYYERRITFYRVKAGSLEATGNGPAVPGEFSTGSEEEAIDALHEMMDKMDCLEFVDLAVVLHFPWPNPNKIRTYQHQASSSSSSSDTDSTSSYVDVGRVDPFASNDFVPTTGTSEILHHPSSPAPSEWHENKKCETAPIVAPEWVAFIDSPSRRIQGSVKIPGQNGQTMEMEEMDEVGKKRQEVLLWFFHTLRSRLTLILPYKSIGSTEISILSQVFGMSDEDGQIKPMDQLPPFVFFLRIITGGECFTKGLVSDMDVDEHVWEELKTRFRLIGAQVVLPPNMSWIDTEWLRLGEIMKKIADYAILYAKAESEDVCTTMDPGAPEILHIANGSAPHTGSENKPLSDKAINANHIQQRVRVAKSDDKTERDQK